MDASRAKQARRPAHMSDYAEACVRALVAQGWGEKISLGGAVRQRAEAERLRAWFAQEFLHGLSLD
jgi:hypothetical protein